MSSYLTTSVESRQLIILCDGTNANLTGGQRDTHVVTLAELLAAHPDPRRVVMYDPGVGNPASLPSAGWGDSLRRISGRIEGLVQGRGVFENITEAYLFLMHHWQEGDEIFVFGYSRGAFTARSLAGMVNRFGLLRPEAESMLPTLLHIYFSGEKPGAPTSDQAIRLLVPERSRKLRIQFVGVWDTVDAVGLPPFQMRFSVAPTLAGKRFMHVRQALALDECRVMFRPRVYAQADGSFETAFGDQGSVKQLWFRGAHADIGGQVPRDEAGLGRDALHWVVSEAVCCGFRLGREGLPLKDEAAVERAVSALPVRAPMEGATTWGGRARLHDTLHRHALWAVAGLAPRETSTATADGKIVTLGEHPSVQRQHPESAWDQRGQRPGRLFAAAAWILGAVIFLLMGQLLALGQVDANLSELARHVGCFTDANLNFQRWQFLLVPTHAPMGCSGGAELAGALQGDHGWFDRWRYHALYKLGSPLMALAWDFAFMACATLIASRWVSWAFMRRAGLRRTAEAPSRWLLVLGRALPLAIAADVIENLLTALLIVMLRSGMDALPLVVGVALAAVSALKWLGWAGVVVLVGSGIVPRRAPLPAEASEESSSSDVVGVVRHIEPVKDEDGFERLVWADKKDPVE